MTTISAGAAAGLLVALMVMSTSDGHSAEVLPAVNQTNGFAHPGDIRGFNPQPDPPREIGSFDSPAGSLKVSGDGSGEAGEH